MNKSQELLSELGEAGIKDSYTYRVGIKIPREEKQTEISSKFKKALKTFVEKEAKKLGVEPEFE